MSKWFTVLFLDVNLSIKRVLSFYVWLVIIDWSSYYQNFRGAKGESILSN